LQFDSFLILAV